VTPVAAPRAVSTEQGEDGARPDGLRPTGPGRGRVAGWLVSGIHVYQLARSGRPTGCRFLPTCSEYAIEAIDQHGAIRGCSLALGRILRCNPWGGHGVDPVPTRRTPCSR
jgi:putative membrane protein insertion efficiency factor